MTRSETIRANDELRQHFKGGKILVAHGAYDIENRTMGRMLCAIAQYDRFDADSLHDEGLMLFAGFRLHWSIEVIDGERTMLVWVSEDALQGA